MRSCSVTDSLGHVNRPNVSNASRRSSRNAADAPARLTDARYSGGARIPSVRKYWVNNWPVMASGRSTAFYQRRSASVSPVAWLDTATCFMLTLGEVRESFFFPPLPNPLPRGERGRTVSSSLFDSSLSNRMNGRRV